ncbi:hypothetical protein [Porphyromonas asaccharolytica]|nr:hypothetical protein [Porphyromonas asaccharolytica]
MQTNSFPSRRHTRLTPEEMVEVKTLGMTIRPHRHGIAGNG